MTGPDFWTKEETCWPKLRFHDVNISDDPEIKSSVTVRHVNVTKETARNEDGLLANLIGKFSSWTKLVRVLGWVLRFTRSARNKVKGQANVTGNLLVSEIKESERIILSWEQRRSFQNWQRDVRLKSVSPVLLGDLRVRGRLNNAQMHDDAKHPSMEMW